MAVENSALFQSFPANADLSASQFCFVDLNSSGKLVVNGAGSDAIGVLQDKPSAADRVGLVATVPGTKIKVKAGASATLGALVASDSTGRAVTAVSGNFVLGKFAEAPGAANDIVTILFQPNGRL